jgi:hypothetical protein
MAVKNLFSGARFVGQAEGERQTYNVFQGDNGYLVAAPRSANNYSVTLVPQEAPEAISRRFRYAGDSKYPQVPRTPPGSVR